MATPEARDALSQAFEHTLYTTERFEHWETCEKELEKLTKASDRINIVTCNKANENVPVFEAEGLNKTLKFCSYHQVALEHQDQPKYDKGFENLLVRIGDIEDDGIPKKPEKCCLNAKFHDHHEAWKAAWLASETAGDIKTFVKKHARDMPVVEKIVCIGLGRLDPFADGAYQNNTDHCARSYLQHVAADRIRTLLQDEQEGKRSQQGILEPITVYAQDPAYCSNCKNILKDELNIQTINGCVSAFRMIGKDTFVMSVCPILPVRQIVGDLMEQNGPPAGILCEYIADDGIGVYDGADPSCPKIHEYAKDESVKSLLIDDEEEKYQLHDGRRLGASVFGPNSHGLYLKTEAE